MSRLPVSRCAVFSSVICFPTVTRFVGRFAVLAACVAMISPAVLAQDEQPRPALTLSFYTLGELATGVRSLPGEAGDQSGASAHPAASGTGGGGGGGGFGGGSGGGFFSVPTQTGGGFGPYQTESLSTAVLPVMRSDDQHRTIIDLIENHIDTESWASYGGEATIEAVNNTLLIRQTKENHERVTRFLQDLQTSVIGGQPLQIEMWWIPVSGEQQQQQLAEMVKAPDARQQLSALCGDCKGYHGSVRTREGMATRLRSGGEKRVVTSVVPVVGTGAIGHQPVITSFPLGLDTIIAADAIPQWEGEGLRIRVQSALTSLSDYVPRSDGESVDDFQLNRMELTTTLHSLSGRPVIAGSLTAIDADNVNASSETQLTLVILTARDQK